LFEEFFSIAKRS